MSAPTLHDDPDPIDRSRACDLADAGLPGHCAAVVLGADGVEHLAVLRYHAGEADYRPQDWSLVAPHELTGLPIYLKEDG